MGGPMGKGMGCGMMGMGGNQMGKGMGGMGMDESSMGKGMGSGMGKGMKRPHVDTGDPEKDELVSRIKAFQRESDENKQAWWNYCDTHLGGNRDPARHDANTLEDFTLCHRVP